MSEVETNGKRKKGERIKLAFIDDKGNEAKSPPENCVEIRATLPKTGGAYALNLTKLSPDILIRLAAFGAATLGRNEVNTTPEGEEEEAEAALAGRWNGFENGTYRSLSTGSATPLILLALARAGRKMGWDEEKISATVAKYQAEYDAGQTEEDQKKSRRAVTAALMAKTPIKQAKAEIEAERAQARAERAKQAGEAGSEDLSDL